MKILQAIIVLTLLGLGAAGCSEADTDVARAGDSPDALAGRLVLNGSSTTAPLVEAIGKRFQAIHPGVAIEVRTGGSERGIRDARAEAVDIGMASRALSPDERDLFGFPIARDGVALIVHRSNSVQRLTNAQIVDIFKGKIANWAEVGGKEGPIAVINRDRQRSEVELMSHYFRLPYSSVRAHATVGDNQECIRAVADNPNGISYVSVGEAERELRRGAAIRLLPVDEVIASSLTVRSGDYPLARPLLLVTHRLPTGLAKRFIDFALSSQVTDLVDEYRFVPYLD
jgi:phosphate transport system substrate-binding protein